MSRGLRHTIWNLLDSVSYPIIYFALVPYLMRYMGPVVFGFWMVLGTVTVVLQLFNFNLGYTAMRHIAHERAAGSDRQVTDIINSLLVITFFQFVGIVVVGCILSVIVSQTTWLRSYTGNFDHGALCFLLASLLGGLKYFEQVFQNIVKSYEHFKGAAIMNMIYRIGTLAGTLIISVLFPSMIVYVLLGNIIFSFCYLTAYYAYMCKVLSFYKATAVQETGLIKRLLNFSVWPWIQTIIIVSTFQADRFWVSSYAGLKEVAAYGFVATMFNHINIIFTAMVAWMSPRIIGMYAKAENPEAEYQFIRSLLAIFTIGSLLVFYWLSPVIFSSWLGAERYGMMKDYIQGFTGFEIAFVHTIMPFFYLNGTGKERQATYITLLCCGACYVLMLGGLWMFHSPVALVRGMTIGVCLTVPLFSIVSNRYITGRNKDWKQVLDMIPVFVAIGIVYTSSPLLMVILILTGVWAIWKYYLIHLNNREVWKQVLGTGRRAG
jgi:O-antigen/teichoic acid export membrane protein